MGYGGISARRDSIDDTAVVLDVYARSTLYNAGLQGYNIVLVVSSVTETVDGVTTDITNEGTWEVVQGGSSAFPRSAQNSGNHSGTEARLRTSLQNKNAWKTYHYAITYSFTDGIGASSQTVTSTEYVTVAGNATPPSVSLSAQRAESDDERIEIAVTATGKFQGCVINEPEILENGQQLHNISWMANGSPVAFPVPIDDSTISVSANINNRSVSDVYSYVCTISDQCNTSPQATSVVGIAFRTIDVSASGKSIAFGKPASVLNIPQNGMFSVGMDAEFDGSLSIGSTNVITELSGKANASHSHAISDVTSLQTELDGKAASSHNHAISDVTSLQTELDGKADNTRSGCADLIEKLNTGTGVLDDDDYIISQANSTGNWLRKKASKLWNYISSKFVVDSVQASSSTSVSTNSTINIDITKSGYTALGIVGVLIDTTTGSLRDVAIASFRLTSATNARLVVTNTSNRSTGNSLSVKPTVYVLYVAN